MSHSTLRASQSLVAALRRPQSCRNPTTSSSCCRRYASTSQPRQPSVARPILFSAALGATLAVAYLYATDTRASVHRFLVPRILRTLYPDAEDAHHAGTAILKTLYAIGLHPRERSPAQANESLSTTVYGYPLTNPIGISAGLDKNADIPDVLFALGAGVVEVGGCTPRPQAGNPKPRVFRVPSLDGMVNRYGLNSIGSDAVASRLRQRVREFARLHGYTEDDVLQGKAGVPAGSLAQGKLLAVQIAKGKETDETDVQAVVRDYVHCVDRVGRYADIIVVNVSSPNTPGLRSLQAVEPLSRLLGAVVDRAGQVGRKVRPKVMVKVSPDEDEEAQMEGICRAVWDSGVDGVIVGNTTKRRTGLVPARMQLAPGEQAALMETGGYSGPAMFDRTLDLVGRYRKMLDGRSLQGSDPAGPAAGSVVEDKQKVIFATGGITNGRQALQILNAGASVAMTYTGMVYGGAGTVTRMKEEMQRALRDA